MDIAFATKIIANRVTMTRYRKSFRVPSQTKTLRAGTLSARSKDLQKGRVDPSATFHGITHEVPCEIDCHKNKISTTPTRQQIRETEPADVRALLDEWESRTGKTAPSRCL